MSEIPRETVLRAVLPILSEAFAGPADPRSTHFVNNLPDCGLLGTLDALTAEQASTPVEEGGATAAAQAEPLRFSLDVSIRWMRGEREKADRARSRDVHEVDDDAWTELRRQLRRADDGFMVTVPRQPADAGLLEGVVATVAHAACHPGALRRIAKHAAARAKAVAA